MGVHRMPIRLLYLTRRRQRVASVRQRSGCTRSSILMPHIRPRKGSRHAEHVEYVGCGEWQGVQEPQAAEYNPRQQEVEDESVRPRPLC